MVSSAFVHSMHLLYLTYGIIAGMGFSMGFLAANTSVNLHFRNRRSIAVAVTSAGSAFGNMIIPWFTTIWLDKYGWRGTFLLLGSTTLQGVAFGAVLCNIGTSYVASGKTIEQIPLKEDITRILTNRAFVWFVLCGTLNRLVVFVPFVMTPEVAVLKGISMEDVAIVFTVVGLSSIIGRLLVGFLIDIAHMNKKHILCVTLIVGGVSTIGYAYFEKVWLFIFYGIILGAFTGTFGFLQSVITVDILGRRRASIGLGFLTLFHGISIFVGPPIAGWIADVTNTFKYTFIYSGGLLCLAAVFAAMIEIPAQYTKVIKDSRIPLETVVYTDKQ